MEGCGSWPPSQDKDSELVATEIVRLTRFCSFLGVAGQDQLRVPQTHHQPHPHLNLQHQSLCKGQASGRTCFLTLSFRALPSGLDGLCVFKTQTMVG